MEEAVRKTLGGVLAYVWPFYDDTGTSEVAVAGYIRRGDKNVGIHLLKPLQQGMRRHTSARVSIPQAIVAASEVTGTLFFDFSRRYDNNISGAIRASTSHYESEGMVAGFSLDDLKSSKMSRVSIYFPGLETWSQITGSEQDHDTGPDGRPLWWSVKVSAAAEERAKLNSGQSLSVSTHWSVTGPEGDRRVFTPLSLASITTRPVHWSRHFTPLMAVQDLLGLAYDGFVIAEGGVVTLDMDSQPSAAPKLWASRLMECPHGVTQPTSMFEWPFFSYESIGGIAGLKRWVTLNEQHARATGPLTSKYRIGSSAAVESQLNDIAIGIEYWVNFHTRQKRAWAKANGKRDFQSKRLARHVGADFAKFVGDPEKWAVQFWDRYGDLKHASTLAYDTHEIHLLAASGRVLLLSALLNRIAGTKLPSKLICEGHRNNKLSLAVRKMLGV